MKSMLEDLNREHCRLLQKQANHARLVKLALAHKRQNQQHRTFRLPNGWHWVLLSYARLKRRLNISVQANPVTAR